MNWEQFEGKWDQVKGKVKAKWGRLTDDDITLVSGKKDELAGKLLERYGYDKVLAERELDAFIKNIDLKKASKIEARPR